MTENLVEFATSPERLNTTEAAVVSRSLNALAAELHNTAKSKGWWDKPRDMGELLTNLHGEVSELWEAYRRGTLNNRCDKPGCDLTQAEEEIADILIRTLDLAASLGIDVGKAVLTKHAFNLTRPYRHGGLRA